METDQDSVRTKRCDTTQPQKPMTRVQRELLAVLLLEALCCKAFVSLDSQPHLVSTIPVFRNYPDGIPSISAYSPGFVITWEGQADNNRSAIYGRYFTPSLTGNVAELSDDPTSDMYNPIVTPTTTGILVAWDSEGSVFYRRFSNLSLTPLINTTKISRSSNSYLPKLARQAQRIVMAWSVANQSIANESFNQVSGVYADRQTPDLLDFDLLRAPPQLSQSLRDIEVTRGGFLLTWFDELRYQVYVQLFNASTLAPAGDPVAVGIGSEPQLVVLDDMYGVVWRTGNNSEASTELRLRFFDFTGKDRGPEILITEQTAISGQVLGQARVARLRTGGEGFTNRFVVVWQNGFGNIYYQVFNNSLVETAATPVATGPGLSRPGVVAVKDGFVVVWVNNATKFALLYYKIFTENNPPITSLTPTPTPTPAPSASLPLTPATTTQFSSTDSDTNSLSGTQAGPPSPSQPTSSHPSALSSLSPASSLTPVVIVIETTTILAQPILACSAAAPCSHVDASGGLTVELSGGQNGCLWYSQGTTLGQTLVIYLDPDDPPTDRLCLFSSADVSGFFDSVVLAGDQTCHQAELVQDGSSWTVIFDSSTCSPAGRPAPFSWLHS